MAIHRLVPAYGRDYSSTLPVMDDFHKNRDFIIADMSSRWDGKPISKDQMEDGDEVQIRYGNLRHVLRFVLDKDKKFDLVSEMSDALKKGLFDAAREARVAKKSRDILVQLGLLSRSGVVTARGLLVLAEIEKRSTVEARLA